MLQKPETRGQEKWVGFAFPSGQSQQERTKVANVLLQTSPGMVNAVYNNSFKLVNIWQGFLKN